MLFLGKSEQKTIQRTNFHQTTTPFIPNWIWRITWSKDSWLFGSSYLQRRSHWADQEGHALTTRPPRPTHTHFNLCTRKVQQFQFQTSEGLLFTGAQKLYGPYISRFSPFMLQFLDNIQWLLIFSKCTGEIDHFSLQFLKLSDT